MAGIWRVYRFQGCLVHICVRSLYSTLFVLRAYTGRIWSRAEGFFHVKKPFEPDYVFINPGCSA